MGKGRPSRSGYILVLSRIRVWICHQFLSRVSILTRDIDIANLSVRPSVRPSVCPSVRYVPVLYENGLTYCHSYFHRTVAQSFWLYHHQTSSRNSDPCGGAKYRWGIKISRFWINNSLYLANTRYHHSYYEKLIGTHTRSIKWCHFQ